MKRFKYVIIFLILIITIVISTSCKEKEFEIALITQMGSLEQNSVDNDIMSAIKKYSKDNKKTYKAYELNSPTINECENTIKLAINKGAKIIICSDYLFEEPIYNLQVEYPQIKFLLFNALPKDENQSVKINNNTISILFSQEQAGFLAGYTAVKDGNKKLCYVGGRKTPDTVNYGYGFVQGAEFAAKQMGLNKNEVSIKYIHLDNFDETDNNYQIALDLYQKENVEVIFACCKNGIKSIKKAAETFENKKIISCDYDQLDISKSVITSINNNYFDLVYKTIDSFYKKTFTGGKSYIKGIKDNGIVLDYENSSFSKFKKQDYEFIKNKFKIENIKIYKDVDKKDVSVIPLEYVEVLTN